MQQNRLQEFLETVGGIFIDDQWQEGPPSKKPEAFQIVFDSITKLRQARDVFNAWQSIEAIRIERPVEPTKVYDRLAKARATQEPVVLFVPWGLNPEWDDTRNGTDPNSPEVVVLRKLKDFQSMLAENKIRSEVLLMPADLYATEVNSYDNSMIAEQMEWLESQTGEFGYVFKPWSRIREENRSIYEYWRGSVTQSFVEEDKELGPRLRKAYFTAGQRSGYDTVEEQQEAAFAYVRERLIEASIVETAFEPIKVSCVEPGKDGLLDGDLPRLYVIDEDLRFPWLKGEPR